jgi:hypothetical protein
VDLRGRKTSPVRQVLCRFEPDASRYGRIANEALDHLDPLICGQEHPLGGATAHLTGAGIFSSELAARCASSNAQASPSFSLVALVIRLGWTLAGSPGILG